MRLFIFPPSGRALAIVALKDYLNIECEIVPVDLSKGDQCTPAYVAMNPNQKIPMLEDDDFVLWESNAILFYLANDKARSGLWPSELKGQADVLRWLTWESAHWDAESCGMVAYETASKRVLGLGPPDPSFIARGQRNFARFAAVLNEWLKRRAWLTGDALTIADFSVAGLVPSAERMQLPVMDFPEITRWYAAIAALPAWRRALEAKDASMAAWQASHGNDQVDRRYTVIRKSIEIPSHSIVSSHENRAVDGAL
jgi:glutathione S-transferase